MSKKASFIDFPSCCSSASENLKSEMSLQGLPHSIVLHCHWSCVKMLDGASCIINQLSRRTMMLRLLILLITNNIQTLFSPAELMQVGIMSMYIIRNPLFFQRRLVIFSFTALIACGMFTLDVYC